MRERRDITYLKITPYDFFFLSCPVLTRHGLHCGLSVDWGLGRLWIWKHGSIEGLTDPSGVLLVLRLLPRMGTVAIVEMSM